MNATDYQRVRLWSGIFSIGANLGLIWAFYVFSLSASAPLLARFDARLLLLVPVAAMLALGFVFDILSGHASETALGRTRQPFGAWARDWFLAALRVGVGLWVALLFLGWMRFLAPLPFALILLGAGAFFAALTRLLPAFLPRSWRVSSEETRRYEGILSAELGRISVPPMPVVWIEGEDESTVNGAISPLGEAQIWLSTNVIRGLSPRQSALLVRRDWWFHRTRKNLWNTAICIGWLLLGLVFSRSILPASDGVQAALGGAAVMTTWCFAALFVWPRLNSAWMRAADRDLLEVAPREEIIELLRRVQTLNASDVALGTAKAGVFHPIPDLQRRLDNLKNSP